LQLISDTGAFMPQIPKKVTERLTAGIKKFQSILASAKARDVGESDTVIIVTDMLSEIFGYDKYSEITSETAIRGTWCDLAIKLDNEIQFLLEVKAIGLELKDSHTKQAIDYSANKGTEWVVLTNGEHWRVYKVTFSKPINHELVLQINFLHLNSKKSSDLELLFTLTKEGWVKSALGEFHVQQQALSRYFLGATILSNPVLEVIRRELRRLSPDAKLGIEKIKNVIMQEVIKREVLEGEEATKAQKKISKAATRLIRNRTVKAESYIVTEASETNEANEADQVELDGK
jgi:predicted type IV restriction endonuclease